MNTEDLTRVLEVAEPDDLRYDRSWFWVLASVFWSWFAFWHIADNHAESPHAHVIAWACVGLAFWFARNF